MERLTLYIVSHTHWDREWYLPFERFRTKLVYILDDLLKTLKEDRRFSSFTLDGQTIILEDYLKVRKDKEEELKSYIKEGRILVGPWYTQPDEFLVSGEALIRNLQKGFKLAKEFGKVMKVGYLPDTFGHISQLPSILKGFGIESAVVYRGVKDTESSELLWLSPSGTQVLTIYLPFGYGSIGEADNLDKFLNKINEFANNLIPFAQTNNLLLMDGGDHQPPQKRLPDLISKANKALTDKVLIQSNLEEYISTFNKEKLSKLKVIEGELRSSKRAFLLPGVLSSRIYIKQRNRQVESLLEGEVEPIATFSWLLKGKYPQAILDLAWKYLLCNQAHDSICCCSRDEVARDVTLRYDWIEEISEELLLNSTKFIIEKINTKIKDNFIIAFVIFNPLSNKRDEPILIDFVPPAEADNFSLEDAKGSKIPFNLEGTKPKEVLSKSVNRDEFRELLKNASNGEIFDLKIMRLNILKRGDSAKVNITLVKKEEGKGVDFERLKNKIFKVIEDEKIKRFILNAQLTSKMKIEFMAKGLPGFGYKTFFLKKGRKIKIKKKPLRGGRNFLENKFNIVEVVRDTGLINIFDKENDLTYKDLNKFVDSGDCGDEFEFVPPGNDTVIRGFSKITDVEVSNDLVKGEIKIEGYQEIPQSLSENRSKRSRDLVKISILSTITLYPNLRRIEFKTKVKNLAKDHRLRVLFPLPFQVNYSYAETPFDLTRREVKVPQEKGWVEKAVGTYPQYRVLDLNCEKFGLLLANKGLPEYEVIDQGKALALTLLRCIGMLSSGSGILTPDAQCLREHEFNYALITHRGSWGKDGIYNLGLNFSLPVKALSTDIHKGDLAHTLSFINVQPKELIVSAIKKKDTEEALIVRLFNPTSKKISAEISLLTNFKSARLVNLNEENLKENLTFKDKKIILKIRGKSIKTIKFLTF